MKVCRSSSVIGAAAIAIVLLDATASAGSFHSDLADVRSMVLSLHSLPKGFAETAAQSYNIHQDAAQGTWTLGELKSWGYVVGYEAQFDLAKDAGPEQISSNAGAYATVAGAQRSLEANGVACLQPGWAQLTLDAQLGDAAFYCVERGSFRGYDGEAYFLAWRQGRFKGSITVSGVQGTIASTLAESLARQQAHQMARVEARPSGR